MVTPYAGATVNVGIDEYLDGKLGNEPRAAFLTRCNNLTKDRTIGTELGNISVIEQGTVTIGFKR